MIILSVTLVPFFYQSGVYTAYEYLERRFDAQDAQLHQPAVPAVARHVVRRRRVGAGGRAVARARLEPDGDGAGDHAAGGGLHDVRRRAGGDLDRREDHGADRLRPVRRSSSAACSACPTGVSLADGLGIAAATGRLRSFDFSFDLTNQYTFWSGTIAALFLFCSYFGTDQSQVQRYLTARSVDEAQHSLLMSAYWKIPLQVLVLLLGVLVFVFYVFTPPPLLFSSVQDERLRAGRRGAGVRGARAGVRRRRSTARRAAGDRAGARRATAATPAARHGAADAARARESALQAVRDRGAGARARDDGRPDVHRRQLHHSDVHPDAAADRPDRPADRRHPHGRDRHDRRRAELAVDRDRHRLLPALVQARGARCALPARVEGRHRALGSVCVRRRRLGGGARLADRGRQPVRLVLLRLDPRACSSWRSAFRAPPATARSSG